MYMSKMAKSDENDDTATDIQRLAQEYVNLWEQQVKTLAGDEGFATAMSKTFELMNAGAASMATMATGTTSSKEGSEDEPGNHPEFGASAQSKSGSISKATGTPSGCSSDDVHQLLERIGKLERRVAELESERSSKSRTTPETD